MIPLRRPNLLRFASCLLLVTVEMVVADEPLAGQAADDTGVHRVTLIPMVGPSWNGTRFQAQASLGAIEVEPGNGLALGGAMEVRVTHHLALTGFGSWSRLAYRISEKGSSDQFLTNAHQSVIRLTGGLNYRFREDARGYFSGGVAANLMRPPSDAPVSGESDRTEWGGYGGFGLDFNTGNPRFRMEFRSVVTKTSGTANLDLLVLEPAGWVADWLLLAGVSIGL